MLPARGKTRHCCAPRGHNKCFWRFSETFCVQDTKFVSDRNVARVAKRVNIWETWSHVNVAATMCPRFAGALVTSVGKETGILSDARDHAPAFRILIFTVSGRKKEECKETKWNSSKCQETDSCSVASGSGTSNISKTAYRLITTDNKRKLKQANKQTNRRTKHTQQKRTS